MSNTILVRPFQIKYGMVDSAVDHLLSRTFLGASLPIINEKQTGKEYPSTHITGQQVTFFNIAPICRDKNY